MEQSMYARHRTRLQDIAELGKVALYLDLLGKGAYP
jgi:hypothetical protein